MSKINATINASIAKLSSRQQAGYAADVIQGAQRWSGADLRGKARKYSFGYAVQRGKASRALRAAGGSIISTEHGLMRTAVRVGTDDYGNAVFETRAGLYVPNRSGLQCVRV